jgi:hypothetical protein
VATGTGREAAVPTWIATVLRAWEAGEATRARAEEAATLCTDCGRCQDHCHLHRPLPEALREARVRLLPPPVLDPLAPLQGEGDIVAVEIDERPVARWLARYLGRPVRRWATSDRLGAAASEFPVFVHRAASIAELVGDLHVVTADGAVARALERARVRWSWLHEFVPDSVVDRAGAVGSCACGGDRPLACCGAAGPLAAYHPQDAARVGRMFVARAGASGSLPVLDTRCAEHLRRGGAPVSDPVDGLEALVGTP